MNKYPEEIRQKMAELDCMLVAVLKKAISHCEKCLQEAPGDLKRVILPLFILGASGMFIKRELACLAGIAMVGIFIVDFLYVHSFRKSLASYRLKPAALEKEMANETAEIP